MQPPSYRPYTKKNGEKIKTKWCNMYMDSKSQVPRVQDPLPQKDNNIAIILEKNTQLSHLHNHS